MDADPPRRRYLVAPDKFKGTLTGAEAAEAIARGIRSVDPTADITLFPFADGGEGTVDAVVFAGGERRRRTVTGPTGTPVEASWACLDGVAFIEMSESSGLRHVTPTPATALSADTTGTGELIADALDTGGITCVVIGVGGSATTDGGFGALRALGVRFLDAVGDPISDVCELARAESIDVTHLHPGLVDVDIRLCADVISPLIGPKGAARVFGPQKGADAETIRALELRLRRVAALYESQPRGAYAVANGGAAGGLAAGAIAVLGATARDGVTTLAEVLGLDERIAAADVVVVGEGSLDEQSRFGKTPVGIARRAQALGVPAIATVGITTLASDALVDDGIHFISSAVAFAPSVGAALADPGRFVECAARDAAQRFLGRDAATVSGPPGDGGSDGGRIRAQAGRRPPPREQGP